MSAHPSFSRRSFVLATGATLAAPFVHAQSARTIRMVVPFPPGGTTDILGRAIAARLSAQMGVNVIVDNRGGAGGSIGAAEAASAAPDGNTLMMGHIGTLAVNPAIYPNLAYDPLKSFVPLAWVADVPNVLVVNAQSPIKDFKAFIQAARAKPGQLTHSSGGNGSAAHITFEYLKQQTDISMLHIPYRGTAPSVTDVMSGQVDATFTGSPAVISQIRAGRLRALAVSSLKRVESLPEVPTVAEMGYPGFSADQWYGVVAPAGMSAELVNQFNAEINKALNSPEVSRSLTVSVRPSHLVFRFPPVQEDTCPLKDRGHVDTKPVSNGAAAALQRGCSCAWAASSAHLSGTHAGRAHSVWPTGSGSSLQPPFVLRAASPQTTSCSCQLLSV